MRNIVLRAFWNWWRQNQFEISSWMCASNIPKFSSSEPHDNVGHPNSLFLPFGSFVSLLLLEPQALCQLPVVDNLLQMPDLQVLQAQYRWWVCLGPGLFRIDDGTWRLICRAQIRIWAFYLGMHTSVHNFIHMGGCDAERQGSASFINQQVMQRMSRTAISNAVVASKDVIFLAGAEAKAAYFTQHLARTNRWLHAFQCRICWNLLNASAKAFFEQSMHVQYRFVKSAHCFWLAEERVIDVFSRCRTRISNLETQEFQKHKSHIRYLGPWYQFAAS